MAFDEDKPAAGTSLRVSNPQILANNSAIEDAIDNEHDFTTGGTQTGDHAQGSARTFWTDTAPTIRVDGAVFKATDLGSLWVDTDDNAFYILTVVTPVWTPISEQLFALLLSQQNTWADTQTFTETPVIPDTGIGYVLVGGIMEYAGASEPDGWKLCNGQTLDNSGGEFDDLWAAFGSSITLYGGTNQASFNVPDMQGRVPIGVGTGDALDATAHTLGQKQGFETHTLITDEMPVHTHTFGEEVGNNTGSGSGVNSNGDNDQTAQITTQPAGSGASHNNLQPSLGLNYIIKY